jgi:hypothetical protein
MSLKAVLIPVFVQVGLTLLLCFWLGFERVRRLAGGKIEPSAVVLSAAAWPARVQQIGNCLENQFEAPVLFYVVVLLAIETHRADLPFVVLEYVFVTTRLWHAAIHTGSNHLMKRTLAFGFGILTLLAMWLLFAARLFAS